MIPSRKNAAVLLASLAGVVAAASPQATAPSAWPINHTLIVLDPAHGGSDSGAVLGDHVFEKDITLAIASRLRTALTANGFTVITTRDSDGTDPLSTDQRAEIANRTHAVTCVVLHATTTGSGVHLYTSALSPNAPDAGAEASSNVPVPWTTAQASFVRQSLSLAGNLSTALGKAHLPALIGQAPIRPLDNLLCPAVAVELAPLLAPGVGATPASDANYQQQVANTLAGALRAWRDSPDLSAAERAGSDGQTTAQGKAIAAAETAGRAAAKAHNSPASAKPSSAQKAPQ